jgi:hypothetical protein
VSEQADNAALHLELDVQKFTLAELEDLEEATGMTFTALGEQLASGDYSIKLLRAVVWILRRRTEPGFTIEQAREVELRDIHFEAETKKQPQDHQGPRGTKRGARRPPV